MCEWFLDVLSLSLWPKGDSYELCSHSTSGLSVFYELALRTCEAIPLGWGLFIVFWDHSSDDTSCFGMRETVLVFRLYIGIT